MHDYRDRVRGILQEVADGRQSVADACGALQDVGFTDIHYSKIDEQREARCGFSEVIFGAGKTADQIAGIMAEFAKAKRNVLTTRLSAEKAELLTAAYPEAEYDQAARILVLFHTAPPSHPGKVAVITAGTSDIPVAREAYQTLRFLGYESELIHDVGVAGIHRLFSRMDCIQDCEVLIVVAGMEAALPSVLGGLVSRPVIAVPTSVGYGTSFGGLTALLGMLNSCASGITVTNIDNGFGGACAAARVLSLLREKRDGAGNKK